MCQPSVCLAGPEAPLHDAPSPLRLPLGPVLQQVLLILLFFGALAPTLPWMEFCGGMENVNVATAMETAREGHWLVPTLHGEARIKKPPFAHWLAAVGILSSDSLGWGARWPNLLCGCILLLSVYHLGRILGGEPIALASAFICGSCFMFLHYAHQASYDMPLAMWVGIANVFVAMAVFQQKWWLGCCGTGIVLGLAILTKGPVALIQSILPAVLFVIMERLSGRRLLPQRWPVLPIVIGILLMLLVALPWYFYLLNEVPGVWNTWVNETQFKDEQLSEDRAPWYNHLQFIPLMMPWAVWLIIGSIGLITEHPYKHNRRIRLAFLWVVVPIFIMSFFHVKRNRYLLPQIGPAAILIAWGLLVHLPGWLASKGVDKVLAWVHWITLAVMVVGLPVVGAFGWFDSVTVDAKPWYSPMLAGSFVVATLLILLASAASYRRWTGSLVLGSTVLMLLLQAMFMWGYHQSSNGRSEAKPLAELMLRTHPEARFFSYHPTGRDPPLEMPIYLNRVVWKVSDPSQVQPATYPQMILIPARGDVSPATPPGCRYFKHSLIGGTWWYVYEVPVNAGS